MRRWLAHSPTLQALGLLSLVLCTPVLVWHLWSGAAWVVHRAQENMARVDAREQRARDRAIPIGTCIALGGSLEAVGSKYQKVWCTLPGETEPRFVQIPGGRMYP